MVASNKKIESKRIISLVSVLFIVALMLFTFASAELFTETRAGHITGYATTDNSNSMLGNIWNSFVSLFSPKSDTGLITGYMTGTGTIGDPFMIYDVNDLQAMRNNLTAHYKLANNIDASATIGWNSGAGFSLNWHPPGCGKSRQTGVRSVQSAVPARDHNRRK